MNMKIECAHCGRNDGVVDVPMGENDATVTKTVCQGCADHIVFYVNAYNVGREYGGPEEGGWYYATYYPIASVPIRGFDNTNDVVDCLEKKMKTLDPDFSLEIRIEHCFGRFSPRTRPQYS